MAEPTTILSGAKGYEAQIELAKAYFNKQGADSQSYITMARKDGRSYYQIKNEGNFTSAIRLIWLAVLSTLGRVNSDSAKIADLDTKVTTWLKAVDANEAQLDKDINDEEAKGDQKDSKKIEGFLDIKKAIDATKAAIADLKKATKFVETTPDARVEQLENEVAKLKEEKAAEEKKLAEATSTHTIVVEDLKKKISDFETEIAKHLATIEQHVKELEEVKKEKQSVDAQLKAVHDSKDHTATIAEQEAKIGELNQKIADLEAYKATAAEELQTMMKIVDHDTKIAELNAKIEELKDETKNATIVQLRNDKSALEAESAARQSRITVLEEEVKAKEKEIAQLKVAPAKAAWDKALTDVATLEADVATAAAHYAAKKAESEAARTAVPANDDGGDLVGKQKVATDAEDLTAAALVAKEAKEAELAAAKQLATDNEATYNALVAAAS